MSDPQLLIASDHTGYVLKGKLLERISGSIASADLGCHSARPVDYPVPAHQLAALLAASPAGVRGLLLSVNSAGMAITANRHPGVRAACASSEQEIRQLRERCDVNLLCLTSDFLHSEEAEVLVAQFLRAPFIADRFERRSQLIDAPRAH